MEKKTTCHSIFFTPGVAVDSQSSPVVPGCMLIWSFLKSHPVPPMIACFVVHGRGGGFLNLSPKANTIIIDTTAGWIIILWLVCVGQNTTSCRYFVMRLTTLLLLLL